jgi:hypothetical protein
MRRSSVLALSTALPISKPCWRICLAKGQRSDGHDVTITMYFEPFKGDLEALYIDAPR